MDFKKLLFIASVAAIALAGCSDDEDEISGDDSGSSSSASSFKVTATIASSNIVSEDLGTRSSASSGSISYSEGDSFGVYADVLDYAEYTASVSGSTTTLTSSSFPVWEEAGTYTFYAVSPYASKSGTTLTAEIPTIQSIVNGENSTPIVSFGSGSVTYDGSTEPTSVSLSMTAYCGIIELILPGSSQQVSSITIAPVSNSDLEGGFGASISIDEDGTSSMTSSGSSITLEFSSDAGDYIYLSSSTSIYIPVGEFTLAAGSGLEIVSTLADGSTRTRTCFEEEGFSSYSEISGTKYYNHTKITMSSLEEMETILSETFGSEGNSYTLETSTSTLYQLAKYYTGFEPSGEAASGVAYWSGLRVDLRQNTFQTDDELASGTDNSYMYFGNTNNNYVGGSGTIYDIDGYTACVDVNDRLSFYLYNVNVGTHCTKAQLSFDVKISGYSSNRTNVGEDAWDAAVANLIEIQYTTDGGYSWIDATNSSGVTPTSDIFRYTSAEMDLSDFDGEFVTIRVRATMKQTLNIDNLAVETIGSDNIVENYAPSVVEVYRQTPTTAYLECRPAAGTPLTESQIQTVVPYVGTAGGTLTEWTEFEIRNIDETYQVFELRLDGLSTTGNDLNVALGYNGQVGGVKYFYESYSNEILDVNFDRFTMGSNPVESISYGWMISGSQSTYAGADGTGKAYYDTEYSRQFDHHNPARRQERFPSFTTDSDGLYYCSTAYRGGNNMEAAWRAEFSSKDNVDGVGAASAGEFFRYDCELYGWTGLLLYELEGYLQVGTGSSTGWDGSDPAYICTPPIGTDHIASGATATVEFAFETAQAIYSCTTLDVLRVEGDTQTVIGTFTVGSYDEFKKNTVTITDATCDTQFKVAATSGSAAGSARFYIDNITLRM